MIRMLLPTPAPTPLQAVPIRSDQDLCIQQLMEAICPPTQGAQERSPGSDLESLLLSWFRVGTVRGHECVSPEPSSDSVEGCFSCGGRTHTTDQCRTLDESFPFLPTGWQAEHIRDKFILGLGPPPSPRGQLPVVGMDNPEPAVLCHGGIARLEETVINRIRSVGHVDLCGDS